MDERDIFISASFYWILSPLTKQKIMQIKWQHVSAHVEGWRRTVIFPGSAQPVHQCHFHFLSSVAKTCCVTLILMLRGKSCKQPVWIFHLSGTRPENFNSTHVLSTVCFYLLGVNRALGVAPEQRPTNASIAGFVLSCHSSSCKKQGGYAGLQAQKLIKHTQTRQK